MVEVVGCDEFKDWFLGLADADMDAVARVVDERLVPVAEAIYARYLEEV